MNYEDRPAQLAEIQRFLYRLGLTPNYLGFFYCAYGVYLSLEDPERLSLITKWLYPEIAQYYHTTDQAVERNIRSVVSKIWTLNLPFLREFITAMEYQGKKPKNGQFLAMLTTYFLEQRDGHDRMDFSCS